ncbi:hypothetical protein FSP39_021946 [Pinctada imbricata]|uniref:Uncharacterized protein n=1 Tax=Pinctada imbricata TaxID=66713 RepID=A0AA88YJD1_PINIB|nr:hypothetical protein FSP39_021946 [Pinctada imbricata]
MSPFSMSESVVRESPEQSGEIILPLSFINFDHQTGGLAAWRKRFTTKKWLLHEYTSNSNGVERLKINGKVTSYPNGSKVYSIKCKLNKKKKGFYNNIKYVAGLIMSWHRQSRDKKILIAGNYFTRINRYGIQSITWENRTAWKDYPVMQSAIDSHNALISFGPPDKVFSIGPTLIVNLPVTECDTMEGQFECEALGYPKYNNERRFLHSADYFTFPTEDNASFSRVSRFYVFYEPHNAGPRSVVYLLVGYLGNRALWAELYNFRTFPVLLRSIRDKSWNGYLSDGYLSFFGISLSLSRCDVLTGRFFFEAVVTHGKRESVVEGFYMVDDSLTKSTCSSQGSIAGEYLDENIPKSTQRVSITARPKSEVRKSTQTDSTDHTVLYVFIVLISVIIICIILILIRRRLKESKKSALEETKPILEESDDSEDGTSSTYYSGTYNDSGTDSESERSKDTDDLSIQMHRHNKNTNVNYCYYTPTLSDLPSVAKAENDLRYKDSTYFNGGLVKWRARMAEKKWARNIYSEGSKGVKYLKVTGNVTTYMDGSKVYSVQCHVDTSKEGYTSHINWVAGLLFSWHQTKDDVKKLIAGSFDIRQDTYGYQNIQWVPRTNFKNFPILQSSIDEHSAWLTLKRKTDFNKDKFVLNLPVNECEKITGVFECEIFGHPKKGGQYLHASDFFSFSDGDNSLDMKSSLSPSDSHIVNEKVKPMRLQYLYNSVRFSVHYAEIVVRVLAHSARPEGECTMCQNPDYYFGIVNT